VVLGGEAVTPLDHALAYARLGWRVVPIEPGYKYPRIDNWPQVATTDETRIGKYWTLHPDHGVGIVCEGSGLFVIDIDSYAGGDEGWADLEAAYGPVPDTVEAITGRGGRHLFFRQPNDDGPAITNAAHAMPPGVDVRGHGGFVVAAPTIHPITGTAYAWEVAHDPLDGHQVAEAPGWLLHLLRTAAPSQEARRDVVPYSGGDSIVDLFAAEHTWPELLEADGWTMHSRRGSIHGDYELWTRPGKDVRDGASASLYWRGSDVLKVFTPNAPPLEQEATYTRFGYWAATRFGSDHRAAASAFRKAHNAAQAPAAPPTATNTPSAPPAATEAPEEQPEADVDDDWATIDLVELVRAIRAGTHEPTLPTILAVEGGLPLFYPQRINSLFGESGGGKTWVALAAVAETARNGERALLVDYEDNPNGIAERLALLGLDDGEVNRIDYRNPTSGISLGVPTIGDGYALIVLDSTGEAMAAGGVDSNADREVAQWFAIVKQLTRLDGGPAVVVLDHVPKDKEAPSAYAIGSQRKRAAVTGAAYRVDTIKEPAKGRDGKLKLTVAKDRPGNRPKGSIAAEVEVRSGADKVTIELHVSETQATTESGGRFRPTVLMERISRYVEINPGCSKRVMLEAVQGKREHLETALGVLIEEAWIRVTTGPRNALQHWSERPFRDAEPAENGDLRTAARPRPDRGRAAVTNTDDRGPLSPPPYGGGTEGRGREWGEEEQEEPPTAAQAEELW
jgi:hypothetical protein